MRVSTAEEFAAAVDRGETEIEVVGEYADKVEKIAEISPTTWAMIVSGLGLGIGLAPFAGAVSLGAACILPGMLAGTIGIGVATAIGSLVATGGISLLKRARDYDVVKRCRNKIVLKKRV